MKTVVILSGGMDSAVLAWQQKAMGDELHLLSFDYGQRHSKELDSAVLLAEKLSAPHQIVNLQGITKLLASALTGVGEVPHGHYAAESMKATVVPHRNMLMLTLAAAYAEKIGAAQVGYAAHAGDHAIYPDCRLAFTQALQKAWVESHYTAPHLIAPFLQSSKADIARLGKGLGVPFELTWSCYEGGDKHCGKCGTCVERIEAFQLAGVEDPTEYAT